MVIYIKRFFIWLLITIFIATVISFGYMYSRDITLNSVRLIDFKVLFRALEKEPNIQDFTNLSEEFLSPKKYPLFPLALVTPNSCTENILPYYQKRFNLSICKIVKDFNTFSHLLDQYKTRTYYDNLILKIKNDNYVYKKFTDKNIYLIGRVKDYDVYFGSGYFLNYLTQEALSWISTTNGVRTLIKKTETLWIIIFLISFVIFIIANIIAMRNTKNYNMFMQQKRKEQKKWEELNEKLHMLQIKLHEEYEKNPDSETEEKEQKKEIEVLEKQIKFKQNEILKIEQKEQKVRQKLFQTLQKLTTYEKEIALREKNEKLDRLELLWRYDPSWLDRKKIEEIVATKNTHLPFLTTQAFIVFEKIIEKLVLTLDSEYQYLTLVEQIHIIFREGLLPKKYERQFNEVRKARNKWFHAGKYPNMNTLEFLISLLEDVEEEPIL